MEFIKKYWRLFLTIALCFIAIAMTMQWSNYQAARVQGYGQEIKKLKEPKVIIKTKRVTEHQIKIMPPDDYHVAKADLINTRLKPLFEGMYQYSSGDEYYKKRQNVKHLFTRQAWRYVGSHLYKSQNDAFGHSEIDKTTTVSQLISYDGYYNRLLNPNQIKRMDTFNLTYLVRYTATSSSDDDSDTDNDGDYCLYTLTYNVAKNKITKMRLQFTAQTGEV